MKSLSSIEADSFHDQEWDLELDLDPEFDEFHGFPWRDEEMGEQEIRRSRSRPRPTFSHRAIKKRRPKARLRPRPTRPGKPRPPRRRPSRPFRPSVLRRPRRRRPIVIREPASPCVCPAHKTEFVRWVQSSLNQVLGLQLRVNGVMNRAARDALRDFQKREGLPVDGIAGPETEKALVDVKAGQSGGTRGASSELEELEDLVLDLSDLELEGEVSSMLSRPALRRNAHRAVAHSKRCKCPDCRFEREIADAFAEPTELDEILRDLKIESEDPEFLLSPVIHNFVQIVIDGKFYAPPEGVRVKNFFASSVPRFKRLKLKRSPTITAVVIHETETSSVKSTVSTLLKRGSGAHFIVAPDGSVTQHGDLVKDYFKHANHYNCQSVGIEVVNPYHASRLGPPWKETLTARWVFGKNYIVPTPQQAETVYKLIEWLTQQSYGRLQIPRTWIGKQDNDFAMNRAPGTGFRKADRKCRRPAKTNGILAHTNIYGSGHADGAWLVLYAYLRSEHEYPAAKAYERAIALSKKVRFKRFMGKGRGSWVKLPEKGSRKLPGDYSCVRPRVDELELGMEQKLTSCKIVPIAPEPRPGFFYTIKYKVDGKGLINLAGRAYDAKSYPEQLKLAQRINAHIYNQKFWVRTKNKKSFPDGIISFLPRFIGDIRAQANANQGAAPKGRAFATIYIPKLNENA